MTLLADNIIGEVSASHAFIECGWQRLQSIKAPLELSTIAAEVPKMKAFMVQNDASSPEG